MSAPPAKPARRRLAPDLEISRIVTGLWQVADMEKEGRALDLDGAAASLADYARAGFDTFDMADHYGSAELIAGRAVRLLTGAGEPPPAVLTKWVPEPGPMTAEVVRAAVGERLERLAADRVDLLQLHWWQYEHPGYLDALRELARLGEAGLIRYLGLTNFDTNHLRLLVRHGLPIVSNQVCFSLLDRRAAGPMSAFCLESGVGILAFGTLAGGLLSARWLGRPEPAAGEIGDWSKLKYKRFVDVAGGWAWFQRLLATLGRIADRHGVSIANVATRWVLEHEAVAAVIVGARLGESEHRTDNLALFGFALDRRDHAEIDAVLADATPVSGDCGDEYRKPPFLTASGDLSHHLAGFPKVYHAEPVPGRPGRQRVSTGSVWEPLAGYSRAVRTGNRVLVSGTTATHGEGEVVCPADAAGQTVYVLDKIAASLAALGAGLEDVVRTRIYVRDERDWEAVARVHGSMLGAVRPANTLFEVKGLIGGYAVEIEAEAEIDA